MKQYKVLFYSPHPHLGLFDKAGYATHMRNIIEGFKRQGAEVELLIAGGIIENIDSINGKVSSKKNRIKKFIPKIIWETIKDLALIKHDKKSQYKLEQQIKILKPDFVYERINYMQKSGVLACKKYGIFHFAEINSPYVEERVYLQGKSLLLYKARKNEKKVLELTNKAIVVSSALKIYFSEKYNISDHKIQVIPNAIHLNNLNINYDYIKQFIQLNKHVIDKKIIGFVGSIAPWHGIDRLINAVCFLANQQKNIIFLIVGGGEQLEYYKQKASALGVSENIIWTGTIENKYIYSLISMMNIAVMPDSNWYGSPIKIFEYGIMSKPIIAPNYLPLQDVIENDKDGILIDKGEQMLPLAILRLLENNEFGNKIAKNFHDKIITNFTWDIVIEKLIKTFTQSKNE